MINSSLIASCCLAMAAILAGAVQAGQKLENYRVSGPRTETVKQVDGSEMRRLSGLPHRLAPGMPPNFPSSQGPALGPWQESNVEPRLMTALGTLPAHRRALGQNLSQNVDPVLVRNWTEFVDPALALRWQATAHLQGFREALMGPGAQGNRTPVRTTGSRGRRSLQEWRRLEHQDSDTHTLRQAIRTAIRF